MTKQNILTYLFNQKDEFYEKFGITKLGLFGSYARGDATEESDIDLYVVTNDDFIPQNFKENSQIFLKYSNKIRSLQKKYLLI